MKKEFALYKGEDLLEIGTVEEIAKKQKVKRGTISFYRTPSYKKRIESRKKKGINAKILICID